MIIDAHSHMHHVSFLTWLEKTGGASGKARADQMRAAAKERPSSLDVKERLAMMDRTKIDFQVVTPSGGGGLRGDNVADQLKMAVAINDSTAKLMEESKGRLIGGGTVPITDFESNGSKEMTRAIKNLSLKAITVPSHIKGKPLDLPEYEPFWAQAEEMKIPIYIHPSSPEQHRDRSYEGDYDLSHNYGWLFESVLSLSRLVLSGVMERHPNLRVVGHHLGGGIPFFMGRTEETYDPTNSFNAAQHASIHLSKPLKHYFSLFYYDTAIGGNAAAIKCAYDVFGPDRLIFATDAPQGPGTGEHRLATYPGLVASLRLPEKDTKKIFADNAIRILNLETR